MTALQKAKNTVATKAKETKDRWNSETSDYFKPLKKAGGFMAIAGIVIKGVALVFPATMPIGLAAWAGEIITLGSTLYIGSGLTRKSK